VKPLAGARAEPRYAAARAQWRGRQRRGNSARPAAALIRLPQTGDGLTLLLQGLLTAGSFRMLTRRTLAATLPVATTAAAASVAVDPIHAALLRHRVTKAALGLIDEIAEPDRYAAAKQELLSSFDALVATVPHTMDGARALVSFMTESADEVGTDARSLDTLRQALDRRAVVLAHRDADHVEPVDDALGSAFNAPVER
jgi:hypothetical protein